MPSLSRVFDRGRVMSGSEIMYLVLVVAAFAVFAATLVWATNRTNKQ